MAKTKTNPDTETPKQPPPGYVDASEDILWDDENAGPNPEDRVIEFDGKGNYRVYPASELPKDEQ
jgi:hypothetical protein